MLAVPDESVHRTKIADWMELKAIASPDGRVGFGTLVSATALTENSQEENIADEDIAEEELVLRIQDELARRRKNVGEDYPFRIDDKGRALEFITPVSEVGSVYLFCLFLSHASDRTVVPKKHARRSVTRTLLKRQIRAAVLGQRWLLSGGLWVVRLRAPFDPTRFASAASHELQCVARAEIHSLLASAMRPANQR